MSEITQDNLYLILPSKVSWLADMLCEDKHISVIEAMRQITPTPDDAGNLQSEDDIKAFVIAFRTIAGILATLKTFSKFDWEDLAPALDEDEYADFKSWYLYYYDSQTGGNNPNSILVDLDFNIDLVRTDKINVVYILNLLKEINRNDSDEMKRSVDLILREIERSDNEKMRYKREIMKSFVNEKFFELDPEEDIIEAYNEYERTALRADIEAFSTSNDLDPEFISQTVHRYFMDTKAVTKESLRQDLSAAGIRGLLRITALIDSIQEFMKNSYNKYTSEGE